MKQISLNQCLRCWLYEIKSLDQRSTPWQCESPLLCTQLPAHDLAGVAPYTNALHQLPAHDLAAQVPAHDLAAVAPLQQGQLFQLHSTTATRSPYTATSLQQTATNSNPLLFTRTREKQVLISGNMELIRTVHAL